jgi:hypothetical protein
MEALAEKIELAASQVFIPYDCYHRNRAAIMVSGLL